MGIVFGSMDSNDFYVASWKAAKSGLNDNTLDKNGYYGQFQAYTVVVGGTNIQYYYYATAGLQIKQYVDDVFVPIAM